MSHFEDQVDALYGDTNVQRMLALSATAEPLRICYPKEINVSRFIAWLLDPQEGHGLGDMAIRTLLTKAGQAVCVQEFSANDRRFLSAASINTQAFSSMILTTEADVGITETKKLDVLAIDPAARLYIAVENKFGAKEGVDQTRSYREGLEKLFPDFRGIYIFLDSNEAEPHDSMWIPIGYDWLTDFIRSCEQRDSVAAHVKNTLAQFRSVVEDEDEDSAASTQLGKLITHVASTYRDELALMRDLIKQNSKSPRAKELSMLLKNGLATKDAKASVRLFQLYCRRPAVWDQCFRQTLFAPFHQTLRARFPGLLVDPRRVVTTYTLDDWGRLLETEGKDDWYWCAGVRVRYVKEQYKVVSYANLADVKAEKRDALLKFINEVRVANGIRLGRPEDSWLVMRRVEGLGPTKAIEEAVEQMRALNAGLDLV